MATELLISVSTQEKDPSIKVLRFTGSLDATNLDKAEAAVDQALMGGNVRKIIFDFAELEYLNSRAVGFLVSLSQKVAAANGLLLLAALKSNVEDIITVVGLNQIIPVAKTVEDAMFLDDLGGMGPEHSTPPTPPGPIPPPPAPNPGQPHGQGQ